MNDFDGAEKLLWRFKSSLFLFFIAEVLKIIPTYTDCFVLFSLTRKTWTTMSKCLHIYVFLLLDASHFELKIPLCIYHEEIIRSFNMFDFQVSFFPLGGSLFGSILLTGTCLNQVVLLP